MLNGKSFGDAAASSDVKNPFTVLKRLHQKLGETPQRMCAEYQVNMAVLCLDARRNLLLLNHAAADRDYHARAPLL